MNYKLITPLIKFSRLSRLSQLTLLITFLVSFNIIHSFAYEIPWKVIDNGGVYYSSSPVYHSVCSIGQAFATNSFSAKYRNYAGYIPAYITIIDIIISFYDAEPSSSEENQQTWQKTTNVTCKITAEVLGGTNISLETIKYRISNSGSKEESFGLWRSSGAIVETFYNAKKIRFQVALPTIFNDYFVESSTANYIQWRCRDSSNNESISSKYLIRILTNDAPQITILQPKDEEHSSSQPVIEAIITDERWGVNSSSITIAIDKYPAGINLLSLNSGSKPDIWQSNQNRLWYKLDQVYLEANQQYKLTIKASDFNNKESISSIIFTAKGGTIADLVPYPCPFDPNVQPITIRYVLDKKAIISVNIYDMSGRVVKTLVHEVEKDPGFHEEKWFGENYVGEILANGVYFCEIVAKDNTDEQRRYTSLAIFGK